MNTLSEESVKDGGGKQIRKSVSSGGSGSTVSGGKTRRYSAGITSSRKSVGEEVNSVPNYLRASTGSCHDFCKFGKHNEHTKSAIPIKFKRSTVVNKGKVTKDVVLVERKKTTSVKKIEPLTYPKIRVPVEPVEVNKRVVSLPFKKAQISKPILSTDGKPKENVVKTLKRSTSSVQPVTVNHGASAGSNGVIKKKEIKTVKNTEMTPKTAPIKKVLSQSHSLKASYSRATNLKETKGRSVKQVTPLKDQNRLQKSELRKGSSDKVQRIKLDGVEASEVKLETMELDFIDPSMKLVNASVCHSSESFSGKDVVEEEATTIHPVCESSEVFLDKELLEESLIVESSEHLEEPLMELVNDPVCNSSGSFSGGNVLEQESRIIHPVYESSELFPDKQLLEEALIVESSELLEELSIAPIVFETSQSNSEKEFLEKSLIAPPVVESSQSNSEKEFVQESLISPSLSESSESFFDEDEFEYTDNDVSHGDDEEEEEEEEEGEIAHNEKVIATTNNDEMETLKKIPRKSRMVISGDKDDEVVKLRFRRGKILDRQAENNNSPKRLKFRRGRVVEGKEVKQHISKRAFEKNSAEEIDDSNPARECVVLKHQGEQEKKDAQGLFNNVIEETESKLVLEDEFEYTDNDEDNDDGDDDEEEEGEITHNEKVIATTNNDEMETSKKIPRKSRMVISGDKDDEVVKLRFRRGKILDRQAENNNSPKRLKFRRGRIVEGKEVKQHISKTAFEKNSAEEIDDSNPARESVVLKHQGEQEKKDAQGLFNNVIEETASKLVETRKSKVKALVGAFETVISLQDGKP